MKVGDKIKVVENTYNGEIYEWDGIVIKVESNYYETKHSRNPLTHPQWLDYHRAYLEVYTRHYKNTMDKIICENCGKVSSETYPCEKCETEICNECTAGYNQFTQIDYNCCKKCAKYQDD